MERIPLFTIDGPLMMPPPFGAIRGEHFFRGFKPLVRSLGGDTRKILEHHNIDPSAADDPDYPINCTTGAAVLDYCSRSLNDNMFGLRLAGCQDPDVYGCLSIFARTAPTMREAMESMTEYLPILHSPGANIETLVSDQTAEFRWHPYGNIGTDEHSISHGLLLFVKFIESISGPEFRPTYVNAITDLPRKDREFMEDRFRCRVNTKASATAIGFDAAYLDRPLKTANRVLRGLLGSYLSQLQGVAKPTLAQQVEAFVALELSSGRCSLERCAEKLGMTVRTFHRHLTQQGISFSEVLEQQRCKAAKRALADRTLSLDEIANSLGYSEQSSFGRAFKRWTDVTPQIYRARVLSDHL